MRRYKIQASSLWPTFLLLGWQIQQQRGCTQWKTSISLRKTYMKWRIHTNVTAPSTVGSNPNNLWAAVTFQRHQIQPLHLGAWCCLLWRHEMAQLTDLRHSALGHWAEFFRILKITSSLEDWAGTCAVIRRHYIASAFHPPNYYWSRTRWSWFPQSLKVYSSLNVDSATVSANAQLSLASVKKMAQQGLWCGRCSWRKRKYAQCVLTSFAWGVLKGKDL